MSIYNLMSMVATKNKASKYVNIVREMVASALWVVAMLWCSGWLIGCFGKLLDDSIWLLGHLEGYYGVMEGC